MKRVVFYLMFALPVMIMAWGCASDDLFDSSGKWICFGMVSDSENGEVREILADNGDILRVASNMIPQYRLDEGDRVLINYSILGSLPKEDSRIGYDIKLNLVQTILSKRCVSESFIKLDEIHRNDSIGVDPADADYAWFGGRYLNIRVGVMRYDPLKPHRINLVWDDTNPDKSKVYLTLRHNAMGDPANYISYGVVSFDLLDLIPPGGKSIKVHLSWTDVKGKPRSDEGIFEPYAGGQEGPANMHDDMLME